MGFAVASVAISKESSQARAIENNLAKKKIVSNMLLEVDKLSDTERLLLYYKLPLGRSTDIDPLRMPLNPLGSRPKIRQTGLLYGNISKPKFVAIQPKPLSASDNGLAAPSLQQLKEEETSRQAGPEPQEGSWVEALTHSYDDELARCWSQPGEAITDSLSPKVQNTELSQLRVLMEQNVGSCVGIRPVPQSVKLTFTGFYVQQLRKKIATTGLLERRNVRFETPSTLSDQNELGNSNSGAVPPSPNTRRMAFNFTPISPRLTPDVPPSPGSSGQPVQLRQLLSNHGGGGGGVGSPFVSPGQTPVPSSLPPSQPHSRYNSGHIVTYTHFMNRISFELGFMFNQLNLLIYAMTMDTPTSFVTEASSVSNDSAFVSPLRGWRKIRKNTPLSVNRSRHNSASNLLVNRVRHSSGSSITVRHTPYATPSLMNHGQDGLFNASARSRHSSGGSPSLPRSAPLSPLVQSFPQQTNFILESLSSRNSSSQSWFKVQRLFIDQFD
ncbi:hypothetical protein OUZ56_028512 [Daphnia magna]|uniref:Uncharacterized protein n=1 Tax=Daphnia magna TaxID=35525 RepID=A0ABR0B431_9CRUS|nr:hypothetical protein OUZ56_028512 [Daphnia magna]